MKTQLSSAGLCKATGISEMVRTNACALQAARRQLTAMQCMLKRHPRSRDDRHRAATSAIRGYMADLRAILKAESQVRAFGAAYIRAQSWWLRPLQPRLRRGSNTRIGPRPSSKPPRPSGTTRAPAVRNRDLRTAGIFRDARSAATPSSGHSQSSMARHSAGNVSCRLHCH
jgi:hypothetical protein